ncbi:MAG: golvesin C-terminal-like domain-containing protein [Armatimonadota bacterium]
MKYIFTILLITLMCGMACGDDYPRTANLWGCDPGTSNYKTWSHYDMLVCYENPPENFRKLRTGLSKFNPDIKILSTTPLANLAKPEEWYPWMKDEWFVKDTKGNRITWRAGQIYTPNLLADGCIDALVHFVDTKAGDILRDGTVDGMMHDSVVSNVSSQGDIDLDRDGIRDNPAIANEKWVQAQNIYFDKLRQISPKMIIMANDADENHRPHINSRLWESARNLDKLADYGVWSVLDAINTTNEWMKGSYQPGYSFSLMGHPLGYQEWRIGLEAKNVATPGEIERVRREFKRMRLGLHTTLMTDAFYGYDFGTVYYGNPIYWYAEYDAPLGEPLGDAKIRYSWKRNTVYEWKAGDKRNPFNGRANIGRMTDDGYLCASTDSRDEWKIMFSTDPSVIHFDPAKTYRIQAECEIVERATDTFQIALRSEKGGWLKADRGRCEQIGSKDGTWNIEIVGKPDKYDDYRLEGFVKNNGTLLVKSLKVTEIGEYYLERDFTGGKVYLNAMSKPLTIKLNKPMRKIKDDAAPLVYVEFDNEDGTVARKGSWQKAEDAFNRYYGTNHEWSPDREASFTWKVNVPMTDDYDIFACLPGDKVVEGWTVHPESKVGFTKKALYTINGAKFEVNQSDADGGWVKVGSVKLAKGKSCEMTVTNLADGRLAADCIRLESRTRRNDGAVVSRITLEPMDGIILLK